MCVCITGLRLEFKGYAPHNKDRLHALASVQLRQKGLLDTKLGLYVDSPTLLGKALDWLAALATQHTSVSVRDMVRLKHSVCHVHTLIHTHTLNTRMHTYRHIRMHLDTCMHTFTYACTHTRTP